MRGKRKAPQLMVGAPAVSSTSFQSQSRRNIKTRRVADGGAGMGEATEPEVYWEEDLMTQAARAAEDFSWDLRDDSLQPEPELDSSAEIQVILCKARNKNSDRPLQTWVPYTDEYCHEALRREGRGSARVYARCAGVKCVDPAQRCPNRCTNVAEYRCCYIHAQTQPTTTGSRSTSGFAGGFRNSIYPRMDIPDHIPTRSTSTHQLRSIFGFTGVMWNSVYPYKCQPRLSESTHRHRSCTGHIPVTPIIYQSNP
ncbi:hypothetical protein C8R46DRAFT_1035133 [Mycena filopes]|nr:hypothetical protein C8R46DRAFT_1035133 [Mycena filopes]